MLKHVGLELSYDCFFMGYAPFCFVFLVSTEAQEGLKNKTQGRQKELNPLTDIPHTAGSKKPVTVGREETMIDILVAEMDGKKPDSFCLEPNFLLFNQLNSIHVLNTSGSTKNIFKDKLGGICTYAITGQMF